MENTINGTIIAVLVGAYILRRMTSYPGVQSMAFVLPSFAISYLSVVLIFFFARFDYSRFQFIASFSIVVVWYFYTQSIERKVRRPTLLVLPIGKAIRLTRSNVADWVVATHGQQLSLPFLNDPEIGTRRVTIWPIVNGELRVPPSVTGVVADLQAAVPPGLERFLAKCALSGLPVYHSKQITESLTGRVEVDHLSENSLGSLAPSSVYFRFKRALDLIAVVVFALPAYLICLAAAIAIKVEDGGPVLFSQQRTGYRGKVFSILKLRTMAVDSDFGGDFTLANDPRITRVGRFLRHYRIDELPQMINIFRGEMSWIGPRPEAVALSRWYEGKIPFYCYRHIVRPGITGWAQVNQGNVAEIREATGKLHYDFFYIKNFSPWLDLLVCARTVGIILTGFGAR